MTRSLAAAVAIASLVPGCASKRSLLLADTAVIVAGAAVRVATDPSHCDAPDLGAGSECFARGVGGYYAGYALIAVGALLFLGTAAFYNPAEPAAAPPAALVDETRGPAAPEAPARDVSPAGRLAQEAELEARAGHCYAVHVLANQIDLLDREYRERVLMRDAATAMCLE
ncbi:MAG TPA: hypothetical protein VGO00_26545 [Kofleriaceae bacterium]|jgi:hypothetical protein|nr:hypothetical protein [Kofleriaceae bacterium]